MFYALFHFMYQLLRLISITHLNKNLYHPTIYIREGIRVDICVFTKLYFSINITRREQKI